jgi:hypothetical protein
MENNLIKENGHFENHPYAFLNENNEVVSLYLFEECENEDLLSHTLENIEEAKEYVSLCNNSKYDGSYAVSAGMKYENEMFYGQAPYSSWIKSDESPIWEAPIALPQDTHDEDGNEIEWLWDEDHKCWSRGIYIENPDQNNGDE